MMRQRLLPLALCLLTAVVLGCTGFWMLFTTFMAHDDEGYVLWTMRQFCAGHPLYTEVFSQYGPSFYAWHRAWHAITGLGFDHESGRWLTLGYWLIATGSCGYIGWRLTRNWLASVASAVLAFAALQEMIREPFHPGGFLAALTAVGAAVCLRAVQENAHRLFVLTGAVIGMTLALTKINVGAFFLVAVGSWVAINSGGRRWGWTALSLTGLGVLVAPLGLMKLLLGEPWVRTFVLVFIASALALLLNLRAARRPDFTWKAWPWMAAAGGVMIAAMAAFCAGTGTPLSRLWDAVVLAPLRHPGVSTFPIAWRSGAGACALLVAGLAVLDALVKKRTAWRTSGLLSSLRLIGGGAVLWQLTGLACDKPFQAVFQFAPALAWLMADPLREDAPDATDRSRSWLAWCALWQILQAYPVAGSQMSWGCFLLVPLLVAGCYDAALALGKRLPRARMAVAAGGALLVIAALAILQLGSASLLAWLDREPLGLPGAKSLRLSGRFTSEARIITRNIATHGDLLFTTPGMMSFNLWSEKPTPTTANATVWAALLDDDQKKAITTRLLEDQKSMVVGRLEDGLLYSPEDILEPFQLAIHVGSYTLWTRKGTTILPLGTVRRAKSPDGQLFALLAASPTDRPISRLEIRAVDKRGAPWTTEVGATNPWRVTPVNLQGQTTGQATSKTSPFNLPDGYFLVQAPLDLRFEGTAPDALEAVLTDAKGAKVEAFRFNKVGR